MCTCLARLIVLLSKWRLSTSIKSCKLIVLVENKKKTIILVSSTDKQLPTLTKTGMNKNYNDQ